MGDLIPKERYTSRAFVDLEMDRLWPRVWQVACREEEVARPGEYVEYVIGDQSILVMRASDGSIGAYYNACLHRGTRLASGAGTFAGGHIRCRYHGWCYDLSGCVTDVPDRGEFPDLPIDLRLGQLRAECWGGFVFVTMDAGAEPLLEFLDPIPKLLGPYRLDEMRFRSYQTLVLPANWKAVVDAFNEGYHVQGAHPQILPWTDDVSIAYEQYERHARYGRLENARRELRPSPRLSLDAADVDEGEILASLVAGLGGAFLKDERAIVEELRSAGLAPGSLLAAYQDRRMQLLASRGFDVTDFTPDRMTSAEDVYWFPNMVGPIYPGSAILFRVRPHGLDPDSCLKDIWVLEWRPPGDRRPMPERRFF
ncbi:MAG: aromatic ring-hydroxylating dioxygenase subunit alpha, partial [Acidimicrobiia bacterium]|nr:aromatic ring-hydroxylating dioxygenase subunit alpha [Acidimicrobiia bacterium]